MFSASTILHATSKEKGVSQWDFPSEQPTCMTKTADHFIIGTDGGSILFLSQKTGEVEKTFTTSSPATALLACKNGFLVSTLLNGNTKIWDMRTGVERTIPIKDNSPTTTLAERPNGDLVMGQRNGVINVYSVDEKSITRTCSNIDLLENRVTALIVHPETQEIISGHADGKLQFWQPQGKQKATTVNTTWFFSTPITALAACSNGRIAMGNEDGDIQMWNSMHIHLVSYKAATAVFSLAEHTDDCLVSATATRIQKWDLQKRTQIAAIEASSIMSAAYSEEVISILDQQVVVHHLPKAQPELAAPLEIKAIPKASM